MGFVKSLGDSTQGNDWEGIAVLREREIRHHFPKIKYHNWPAICDHCDSVLIALAWVWRQSSSWWHDGELREGGELSLGDSAAPLTLMEVMLAYRYVFVIGFVAIHVDSDQFMGWPRWIQVPPNLPFFKHFVHIFDNVWFMAHMHNNRTRWTSLGNKRQGVTMEWTLSLVTTNFVSAADGTWRRLSLEDINSHAGT